MDKHGFGKVQVITPCWTKHAAQV